MTQSCITFTRVGLKATSVKRPDVKQVNKEDVKEIRKKLTEYGLTVTSAAKGTVLRMHEEFETYLSTGKIPDHYVNS